MTNKKIAILYIATGKYIVFWKDFFKSSEKYFLNDIKYQKHYFVFTDSNKIEYEDKQTVHKIYQEQLPWPYITLDRFSIFKKVYSELKVMDYIFFFNSNMLFVNKIGKEFLPNNNKPILMVIHPGFFNKDRKEFTYEKSKKSLAYIDDKEGEYYFMGGLNGGIGKDYLSLIDELDNDIKIDKSKNVIALWHDESHLNRYAKDNMNKIKILDSSYGYPEGWDIPFQKKIVIRDKNKYGGHNFLRDIETNFFRRIKNYIINVIKQKILRMLNDNS